MTNTHSQGMDRGAATRRVMMSIAVGPMQISLPYTAEDGSKPLVVTTPNEYLSDVIARVQAVGGSANVALAEARKFTIFMIESADDVEDLATDDEVNSDISMGMFWLKTDPRRDGKRSRSTTFRMKNGGARVPTVAREFSYA